MSLTRASSTVIDSSSLLRGNFLQVAYSEILTSQVYSNAFIQVSNSIPQITQGVEVLNCAITPKFANSILLVESNIFMGENINDSDAIIMALFRDSTVNAISTSMVNFNPSSSSPFGPAMCFGPCYLKCRVPANSTSQTIFRIRVGGAGASSNAVRINGSNGQAWFGGTLVSYLSVYEVAA